MTRPNWFSPVKPNHLVSVDPQPLRSCFGSTMANLWASLRCSKSLHAQVAIEIAKRDGAFRRGLKVDRGAFRDGSKLNQAEWGLLPKFELPTFSPLLRFQLLLLC